MSKYYYIDKYISYYKNNDLIHTDRVNRQVVPDLTSGKQILSNIKPNKIENKNYISVYEGYKMIYQNDNCYKCYYNELTPNGVLKNV